MYTYLGSSRAHYTISTYTPMFVQASGEFLVAFGMNFWSDPASAKALFFSSFLAEEVAVVDLLENG